MSANSGLAINQIGRIRQLCDFLDSDAMRETIQRAVPVSMVADIGSLGFDVSLWVGFGIVGLWAALDAFAEREMIVKQQCRVCGGQCLSARFAASGKLNSGDVQALNEIEDLRHLYAHNFAGRADADYFRIKRRHVLVANSPRPLALHGMFGGDRVTLGSDDLGFYADRCWTIIEALLTNFTVQSE